MSSEHDLARFLEAQEDVMPAVRHELAAGRKRTHWMWFVFPQIAGLGHSAMAERYAIRSLAEAEAYLRHPMLGERLVACTNLVLQVRDRSVTDIFGTPDDMKFRSCMTLFARVPGAPPCFRAALGTFFEGRPDDETLRRLEG